MEPIESSETSAYSNSVTPGTYPKEKILQTGILSTEKDVQHKRVKCSGTRRRVDLYIYRRFSLACYFNLHVRRSPPYIFSENSVNQQFLRNTAEHLNIYRYHCEHLNFKWREISKSFILYNHGSVHRKSMLIRFNEKQQYAGVYLLQNYSTCFGCLSHPSSGVHKTVTAASGTGHITCQSNNLPPVWPN